MCVLSCALSAKWHVLYCLLFRMLFVSFFVKNFNDFMHVACFVFFVIYVDNSGEVRGSFDK